MIPIRHNNVTPKLQPILLSDSTPQSKVLISECKTVSISPPIACSAGGYWHGHSRNAPHTILQGPFAFPAGVVWANWSSAVDNCFGHDECVDCKRRAVSFKSLAAESLTWIDCLDWPAKKSIGILWITACNDDKVESWQMLVFSCIDRLTTQSEVARLHRNSLNKSKGWFTVLPEEDNRRDYQQGCDYQPRQKYEAVM